MRYPKFTAIEIDEKHLIINMVNPMEGRRDFRIMAPSKPIFDKVVELFQEYMQQNFTLRNESLVEIVDDDEDDDLSRAGDDSDDFEDLIAFPVDGSNIDVILWVLLFPLRFLMHWTIPDVRVLDESGDPTTTLGKAFLATFMCLVWLIIGSYAMVASLEALAALMDIPDAVIGFTVSAAGNFFVICLECCYHRFYLAECIDLSV
jgi:Ca2+/Na+ antiporter